jgi:hypothetical protein
MRRSRCRITAGRLNGFREVELTGTKFSSILKAELVMLPIIFIASFLFWSFFWRASPIPSAMFPYAMNMWPYFAQMDAVWKQINRPESEMRQLVLGALNLPRIGIGFLAGLGLYWLFSAFKMPLLLFYGLVGGVGTVPALYATTPAGRVAGQAILPQAVRRGELGALRARAAGGLLLRHGDWSACSPLRLP